MLHERIFYVFELSSRGPYAVVAATGEIDIAAADDLCGAVRRAARRGPRVVVDLRAVTFMDTFALRALIGLQHEAMTAQDWSLHVVAGPSRGVQRLLDLAGGRDDLRWMSPEQLAG
jgi:stage II sporulation protein AA (anti-sigma F factor antagonist)